MSKAQGGKCANPGCVTPLGPGTATHVDHCHVTGKVRALLCHGCNTSLGLLREDPARIRGLALYAEVAADFRTKKVADP